MGGDGAQRREAQHPAVHQGQEGHLHNQDGKVERKLRNSIQYTIEHDGGIPEAVSFKIPIHGIWREWAVGYGQPRVPGKYVNPHPRIRRSMVDWLDEPIDRNAERLFDLAAEF